MGINDRFRKLWERLIMQTTTQLEEYQRGEYDTVYKWKTTVVLMFPLVGLRHQWPKPGPSIFCVMNSSIQGEIASKSFQSKEAYWWPPKAAFSKSRDGPRSWAIILGGNETSWGWAITRENKWTRRTSSHQPNVDCVFRCLRSQPTENRAPPEWTKDSYGVRMLAEDGWAVCMH